ncbi:ornithine decarboxylase, putative [Aspergillus fumigatus A1163]|uniref:ornithine decarboxylase n=1 Tax=Aspergillus fumigatus (strain CBS 144.89 / FGSC A1163 / CEA10) TaxID=451804 RepID=B0Y9J3_ASPFC|nr:ornithine decarboxylase, putative [Aspergillus fumigatus A1163]
MVHQFCARPHSGGMDSTERLIDLAIQTRLFSLSNCDGWAIADEPFFVADLGQVIRQHRRWRVNLPDVLPFYAVKCNPDPNLLRLLANLGTGFDCASIEELRTVLSLGVDPCRIIFANPCKSVSSLVFAARTGVTRTTFDNLDELDNIRTFLPNAELVLRLYASDSDALINLGEKFGATVEASLPLLQRARELGLDVCGVSFHVGTGASNASAYVTAIRDAKIVFGYGKSLGFDMNLLDIGGGFQDSNLEDIACVLRPILKEEFPGVRLLAEPGRYYVRSAYTLACKVLSRRRHSGTDHHDRPDMLYQNDGVYGNFMNVLIEKETVRPSLVAYTWPFHSRGNDTRRKLEEHRYTIWGPTCDSMDCVAKDVPMTSEIRIGDWLKYKNMGAYTIATATQFNGFSNQYDVIYINTESMDHQVTHRKSVSKSIPGSLM